MCPRETSTLDWFYNDKKLDSSDYFNPNNDPLWNEESYKNTHHYKIMEEWNKLSEEDCGVSGSHEIQVLKKLSLSFPGLVISKLLKTNKSRYDKQIFIFNGEVIDREDIFPFIPSIGQCEKVLKIKKIKFLKEQIEKLEANIL